MRSRPALFAPCLVSLFAVAVPGLWADGVMPDLIGKSESEVVRRGVHGRPSLDEARPLLADAWLYDAGLTAAGLGLER